MAGPGGEPIMTTRVDITGNVAPLQQAVTQAKAEVKKLEAEVAKSPVVSSAGGSVGSAVGKAGAAAKGADQELRTSASRIFGIAGAATAAGAAIDRLIGSFNGFRNAGRDVVNQADSIGKALGSGSDINQGLTEAEKRTLAIASATKEVRKDIDAIKDLGGIVDLVNKITLGVTSAGLTIKGVATSLISPLMMARQLYEWYQKGTVELEKQAQAALEKAQKDAEGAAAAQERNRQEALLVESRRRVVELQNAELTGINKLNADYRKNINEIDARRKGASAALLASLDDEAAAEKANYTTRVKRLADELREKREAREQAARDEEKRTKETIDKETEMRKEADRRQQELVDRQTQALRQAYADVFDRIRADAANAFPAERLIGSIETMIERLEALADQRSRLRG
jgi:predicted DNA-binding ribbon-helix-helix protein